MSLLVDCDGSHGDEHKQCLLIVPVLRAGIGSMVLAASIA
jgi:hypothetical protein